MQKTLLMGILNITPDSFSDGGDFYNNPDKAVKRARQMLQEGADIIDIGGESTRPGSEAVTSKEELRRVIPVIQAIKKELGDQATLSIDTNKHTVADEALGAGCNMVNSLGGFMVDKALAQVVAQHNCNIMLYHIKGTPQTMQQGEIAYTDVIKEINDFFEEQIIFGTKHGIQKEHYILDPGIGFGKNVEQNLEIIKRLKEFEKFELPIAIGVSRKSHLGMVLQSELALQQLPPATERLEAALAETAIAVLQGATIIRTHDIQETNKFLAVLDRLRIS